MRKAIYAASLVLALVLGFHFGRSHTDRHPSKGRVRRVLYYVDPMHPAYKSDKPGIAPDCGMPLEPVYADESSYVGRMPDQASTSALSIDSRMQQLVGITVAEVRRTSGTHSLRIPGKVTPDERRVYRIS